MRITKRIASFILIALIIFPFTSVSATTGQVNVRDTSLSYSIYTGNLGLVYDLADTSSSPKSKPFQYDIPDGGATVIVFYSSDGNRNSRDLISDLSNTKWALDDCVNLIGVDCLQNNKSASRAYLETYDIAGQFDHVYYNQNGYLLAWYLEMISRGGNMNGVTQFTQGVVFSHVLIITKESGAPVIRYSLSEIYSADIVTSLLGGLIDIPDGRNDVVEVTVTGTRRYDYVEETVDRVNAARASVGASALTLSPTLTEAAMKRAEECAVYYGHIRPSGYSCFTLVNNTGIYPSGLAILENIACSRGTPESVMSAWIGSPAHYKNIISSRPTQIGIGCFYNNGYAYWAQVFGTGKETGDLPYDCAVECSATFETLESHLTERGDADSVEVTMCTGVKLDVMMRNLGIDQNFTFYSQMRPVQSAICDQSGSAIAVIDATGTCYGLKEGTGTFSLAIYEGDRFASEVAITVTAHRMPDSYSMSTPPTYTSPGVAVKICPLCGGVAETIEIPRLISTVPGDVDGDGLVTAKDVLRMRKTIAGLDTIDETYFANGDFDGDGDVTMKDVLRVRKIIAGVD